MDLTEILQIAIPVRDIERATAFHSDVLELRMLMNGPSMAFFDRGGVRLYLSCSEGARTGEAPAIYFRSGNIDKQLETLKKRNVSTPQQPQ
jgi:predicted enzyme related to lactoylglutathione lyase